MKVSTADLTATDQFCGAGGQTAGAKQVAGVHVVVALNHWRLAIETHNTNHPETVHECADISQVDPRRYPRTDILLTSPECGNHTVAKNHQQAANALTLWDPRLEAERSRATMWDVPRFAECHRYRLIIVENVVEVRSWAPFDAWIAALASLGYRHEFVYFNSRFAPPTPGNRDRLYTVLWHEGCPAPNLDFTPEAFCDACDGWVQAVQTWRSDFDTALAAATRRNGGRRPERIRWGVYGVHYDYRCPACASPVVPVSYPAWTAVDWALPGARIGDAARPLVDATRLRIQKGIDRFWPSPLVVPLSYAQDTARRPRPVWEPFPTQTGRQDQLLAHPFLDALDVGAARGQAPFISELRGGGSVAHTVDQPASTVSAGGTHHMLIEGFLAPLRSGRPRVIGLDGAMATQVADGANHLLVNGFYTKAYGDGTGRSMAHRCDDPFGTVTAQDHHGLVRMPLIDSFYGAGGPARPVTGPATTATTRHRHALVESCGQRPAIDDCLYRMLQPHEIQRVMAFADDYRVLGSQRQRVRQLGNAVTPPVSHMLVERCVEGVFA
jgi:DNA (cytosine-5)-methyltransferase 1